MTKKLNVPTSKRYPFAQISIAKMKINFQGIIKNSMEFRHAVSTIIGKQNDLFHNRHLQTGQHIYRQPLIHYFRLSTGNCILIGFNQGGTAIKEWYNSGAVINLKSKVTSCLDLEHSLTESNFDLKIHSEYIPQKYLIENYLPLNSKNHARFKKLNTVIEKETFLGNILSQHIHTFARYVEWDIPEFINVCQLKNYKLQSGYKKSSIKSMKSFDIEFYSPLILPSEIFLGKRSALGFGCLKSTHKTFNCQNKIISNGYK